MQLRSTASFLVVLATLAPNQQCSPADTPDDATDGGPTLPADAGRSADATVLPDASARDAASDATVDPGADAALPVDAPDATDADTADTADGAPATPDAAAPDGGAVPRGPTWANWPMPNPPASGLPNPASYDTSVAGVVHDNVTGLTWQQTDVTGAFPTVNDAAAYCSALRLGGFADWRLPSRVEIWSIDDYTRTVGALPDAFTTTIDPESSDAPWTSTVGHGQYKFDGVGFTEWAAPSVSPTSGSATGGAGAVRCVRGSTTQPSPHYTMKNGTVHDNGTGLTWQQDYDPIPSLPNGVANYCGSLSLDGGGWRGPSVKELETIVDDDLVGPALDTSVFHIPTGTGNVVFYSVNATPSSKGTSTEASWYVNYQDGASTGVGLNQLQIPPFPSNNYLYQVRCVR